MSQGKKVGVKREVVHREVKTSSNKNVLEIEGKLSIFSVGRYRFAVEPIFYLVVFMNMERQDPNKVLSMQFSPTDIATLIEVMRYFLSTRKKEGLPAFHSGGSSTKKRLVVSGDEEVMYLNFTEGEKKITITLNTFEGLGLVSTLEHALSSLLSRGDIYREKYSKWREDMLSKEQKNTKN